MPAPLIECVPNFSEARRPEIIDAIESAISAVEGVLILDRHSDLDHNRTVITLVGSPTAVEEAAYLGIARAAELIDLDASGLLMSCRLSPFRVWIWRTASRSRSAWASELAKNWKFRYISTKQLQPAQEG